MRLIDADELDGKAQLAYRIALSGDDVNSGRYSNVEFTDNFAINQDDIADSPTIDAVPVVRCGECKGWEKQGRKNPGCDIARMFGFGPTDFCSRGKRKEAANAQKGE